MKYPLFRSGLQLGVSSVFFCFLRATISNGWACALSFVNCSICRPRILQVLALLVTVAVDRVGRVRVERDLRGQGHELVQDRLEAVGPLDLPPG